MKISTQDDFKLPPEDLLLGTVKEILDEGVQPNPFKPGKNRHRVKIMWTLSLPDGTTMEQPDWLTFSLHPKATLYKVVKALRGGIIPKGEYELSDFVGEKAMVQPEHYLSKTGQKRSRIAAYYPAPNGHGVVITDNDLPDNLR
jgi:hypothetical protein